MRGITQDDVFRVANEIAATGEMPTREAIYQKLGRGSGTTLHKYLVEWRTFLLKHAGKIQNSDLSLLKENKILRDNVERLTILLADTNAELNNAELKVQELEVQMEVLRQQNHEYQVKGAVLETKVNTKEQLMESLKDEMRQMHQDAIEAIRQNSDRFHEQLMQEKIKVINLEEKIRALQLNNLITEKKDLDGKKGIKLSNFLEDLNQAEGSY